MYKRLKKDSKWSILKLGSFKTEAIKEEILAFNDEWLLDTSRQNFGYVHYATQMFRLCATDYDWIPGTPIETIYHNSFKTEGALKELADIYNQLEEYYCGKVIRCEAIKLSPNSEVLRHTDGGALLHYSRRIHIPIITDPSITFTVMDDTIHMEESGWYEINNQMPHGVNNPSDIERTHLIIDILPDDMLNYTKIGD